MYIHIYLAIYSAIWESHEGTKEPRTIILLLLLLLLFAIDTTGVGVVGGSIAGVDYVVLFVLLAA